MNEMAFHQFTELSVLLLVNDKKNKERQSADSGEVKRITGTHSRSADSQRRSRDGNCATVHTKSSMIYLIVENETHGLRRQALSRLVEPAYNWFTIGRSVSMVHRNSVKKLLNCNLNSVVTAFADTSAIFHKL